MAYVSVPKDLSAVKEKLLFNLLDAYPDKAVAHLSRDHGNWAEKLSELYKALRQLMTLLPD